MGDVVLVNLWHYVTNILDVVVQDLLESLSTKTLLRCPVSFHHKYL